MRMRAGLVVEGHPDSSANRVRRERLLNYMTGSEQFGHVQKVLPPGCPVIAMTRASRNSPVSASVTSMPSRSGMKLSVMTTSAGASR